MHVAQKITYKARFTQAVKLHNIRHPTAYMYLHTCMLPHCVFQRSLLLLRSLDEVFPTSFFSCQLCYNFVRHVQCFLIPQDSSKFSKNPKPLFNIDFECRAGCQKCCVMHLLLCTLLRQRWEWGFMLEIYCWLETLIVLFTRMIRE